MNVGKTLFAQIMEYVPWKTFGRIIDRHGDDASVPVSVDAAYAVRPATTMAASLPITGQQGNGWKSN